MAVKIFIKRLVPQDKARAMIPLFRQMRASAATQSGYITGETLRHLDKPEEFIVISTWQSIDNWREWVVSRDRMEIQNEIDARLTEASVYEIYQYG